jgi:hypothetical protein
MLSPCRGASSSSRRWALERNSSKPRQQSRTGTHNVTCYNLLQERLYLIDSFGDHKNMDYAAIKRDLLRLCQSRKTINVFGSDKHDFRLNPPLGEDQIRSIEHQEGIVLPSDYRGFLINVGNGGAGPYFGICRLGEIDYAHNYEQWFRVRSDLVGSLSSPFPFAEPWNDLSGRPDPDQMSQEEYEQQLDAFERRYWMSIDGAMPICHIGHALRIWLVVTGEEKGNLWRDARADEDGFYPLEHGKAKRVTFGAWYRAWLDEAMRKLG